jgi:hypothetical protein
MEDNMPDIDLNRMTKKELATYIVKNMKFKEWYEDFAYSNWELAQQIAKAFRNRTIVKFMMGYDKAFLIETIENYDE